MQRALLWRFRCEFQLVQEQVQHLFFCCCLGSAPLAGLRALVICLGHGTGAPSPPHALPALCSPPAWSTSALISHPSPLAMLHGCQLLPDVLPLTRGSNPLCIMPVPCSPMAVGCTLVLWQWRARVGTARLEQLHNVTCTRPSSKPELAGTAGPGMQGSISSSAAPARIWREHLMPRAVPQGCSSQLALAAAGTRFLDLFPNPLRRCWGGQRVQGQS